MIETKSIAMIALIVVQCLGMLITCEAECQESRMKEKRKELAHRQRRIIFDNDGNDVLQCEHATKESFLEQRLAPLRGTQVDTVFYCTRCCGFGYFTHSTKVGAIFTCTEGRYSKNKMQGFLDQGLDPLGMVVEFCHQNDLEVFWSMRMNDTHDATKEPHGELIRPPLKKKHPEWLLGTPEERPRFGRWSAVDYGREEIRDYAFRVVEEVCKNYDVDGVSLDFFRHLQYFKSHAYGGEATQAERDLMTELLQRIRRMADTEGQRRGRPILLSMRVPDSVDYCRAVGLDVERWLAEDLIDVMVVTGYFRLNPWETSVDLGHRYEIPVYACLSESRMKGDAGATRNSLEGYRGRAMQAWNANVDGLCLFNYFKTTSPLYKELGDRAEMIGLDKVYTTGGRGTATASRWLCDGEKYLNRAPVSPESPRALSPGESVDVVLNFAEPLAVRLPDRNLPRWTLRLIFDQAADGVSVHLRGRDLQRMSATETTQEYVVPPELLPLGENVFCVRVSEDSKNSCNLQDMLLDVRY